VIGLNRKILGTVALMAVAMLMLPLSAVSAKKPEPNTMPLEGNFYILIGLSPAREFPAGESGHRIYKWRDLPAVIDGDIVAGELKTPIPTSTPGGYWDGNWVIYNVGTGDQVVSTVGVCVFEDAEIDGIGTGDLKIFAKDETLRIISGTGDFKGLKGTGTFDKVSAWIYSYTLEVQIP
jgi:hypothetical protein